MSKENKSEHWYSEQGVQEDLQRQLHLFKSLIQNSLTISVSLRDNYYKNTAKFVRALRNNLRKSSPVIKTCTVANTKWSELQGEVVTFIDGGIGRAKIANPAPILLRVGSYCVRTGERNLAEREKFGYYPIILGDLVGGDKQRADFPDIVRITAELLGGLAALKRTPDLRVLMFHGPLVYTVPFYMGHIPFTEQDVDLFLHHYAHDQNQAQQLKKDFLKEAQIDIYPRLADDRSDEWVRRRLFEPLSWMAFLYRRLIEEASQRTPRPIIAGIVERGELREFSETVLLENAFRRLRQKNQADYFNQIFGRTDLTSPKALLDKLHYTDSILLGMLLEQGQYSEAWEIDKYRGFRQGKVSLPGETGSDDVDFTVLRPGEIGFPRVNGCYVKVSDTTEPFRIEVFDALGPDQIPQAVTRAYLYAQMLPGYGFPVGLDVADKFARVPQWLTDAYSKEIRYKLGISLQNGEISDAEMRRILIRDMYMTQRDWLFRPDTE